MDVPDVTSAVEETSQHGSALERVKVTSSVKDTEALNYLRWWRNLDTIQFAIITWNKLYNTSQSREANDYNSYFYTT